MTIKRMWVSSQVPKNSGGPAVVLVDVARLWDACDDGITPWLATRMEVAIRAAMCSIVNPGGRAGSGW